MMDGWAVARTLRADPGTARIPIIVLTARATAGDKARMVKAGSANHRPEPADFPQLLPQTDAVMVAAEDCAEPNLTRHRTGNSPGHPLHSPFF